jgi:hypothetical protein
MYPPTLCNNDPTTCLGFNCLNQALPLLCAVGIMLLGLLILYGIAAVQIFTDVYHNVCMGPDPHTGEVS